MKFWWNSNEIFMKTQWNFEETLIYNGETLIDFNERETQGYSL